MTDDDMLKCIPEGKENSISRPELCRRWGCSDRQRRKRLEQLQKLDIGPRVIIRSGKGQGIYISTDPAEVRLYRQEIISKGSSILNAISQCNRFLKTFPKNKTTEVEYDEM